jgi:hypothetical protein
MKSSSSLEDLSSVAKYCGRGALVAARVASCGLPHPSLPLLLLVLQ